jgi:hypothetical protein
MKATASRIKPCVKLSRIYFRGPGAVTLAPDASAVVCGEAFR